MVRVLSFDISTAGTGWSFYDGVSTFQMGVIVLDKANSLSEKFLTLYNASNTLIDELCPEVVVVEGVFAFRNIKTTKILSEAGGMVKLNCYSRKIPVATIENTTVKAYFKTRKKEDLFKTMMEVTKLDVFRLDFSKYNDMVDSFALLLYYLEVIAKQIILKQDGTINFLGLHNVD